MFNVINLFIYTYARCLLAAGYVNNIRLQTIINVDDVRQSLYNTSGFANVLILLQLACLQRSLFHRSMLQRYSNSSSSITL